MGFCVWQMGITGPYTVPYTDMRHGCHVVSVAFDLHMHSVCCMVLENLWLCELMS